MSKVSVCRNCGWPKSAHAFLDQSEAEARKTLDSLDGSRKTKECYTMSLVKCFGYEEIRVNADVEKDDEEINYNRDVAKLDRQLEAPIVTSRAKFKSRIHNRKPH